jgi:hypothetical protein
MPQRHHGINLGRPPRGDVAVCQRGWTSDGHLVVRCTLDRSTPGFRAGSLKTRRQGRTC